MPKAESKRRVGPNDEQIRDWLDNTVLRGNSCYQTTLMALRLFGEKVARETAQECANLARQYSSDSGIKNRFDLGAEVPDEV